jgi:NAD(P)-dependent dehydrogenase (short-subunit alcohol dehydrogenase family)
MPDRLKDKVAIVSGAGQTPGATLGPILGNGRATALLFAREGARVLLVDVRPESAEETRALIVGEGGEASVFAADVTRAADCRAIPERCVEVFGRVDILVNNVGIGGGDSGLLKLQEANWDRIMDTNLKSMFLMCQAVMPYLVKQGAGAIVNISSIAAIASMNLIAYKVSKAGVNALTHAVAMGAAAKGVRVNAIMPGLIHTPMAIEGWAEATGKPREDIVRARNERVPLKGGMGSAWDIAHAALFLASDEAKFITAAVLPVDGGQSGLIG